MSVAALLVLAGAAWYFSTPQERTRVARAFLRAGWQLQEVAVRVRPARTPFDEVLRQRTPVVVVTPTVAAVSLVMFVFMLFGAGSLSNPDTAIAWGASFGPRTTNGEWWRLVTALIVDPRALHLIVTLIGLAQVGVITERLVGPAAFAGAYLCAGLMSGMMGLWLHPIDVISGASGCVFGIYGVFVALLITGIAFPSSLSIPTKTLVTIAPTAGIFLLYNVAAGLGAAELTGLVVGLGVGFALAKDMGEQPVAPARVAAVSAAVLVCVIVAGVPRRGVVDLRPEIQRVAELEHRTAGTYDDAVRRFAKGQLTIGELIQVIDRSILPELRAAHAHLKQLQGVPKVQAQMLASVDEYFTLRDESWRARSAGLRRANMVGLRSPDDTERASLEVLERITNP